MNQWTSLQNIRSKLDKKWKRGIFLREATSPENLFPLRVPLLGPTATELSDNFSEAREWIKQFLNTEKKQHFDVQWTQVNHRLLGTNEIPVAVMFDSMQHLIFFLGKNREFELFIRLKDELLNSFPQLHPWLLDNPLIALEFADVWSKLIRVTQWINDHPRPGIYIRQMSIPDVDTKFIERYKKLLMEWLNLLLEPSDIDPEHTSVKGFEQRYGFLSKPMAIRFRLLDKALYIQGLSDLTIRTDEFCGLAPPVDIVFVTENDVNGLAFPDINRAMVLFGRGYGFDFLKGAHWLQNKKIYYWGDIDTHGFIILNQFRTFFPQTESIFMDRETLLAHKSLWVKESIQGKAALNKLSPEEFALYNELICSRYGDSIRLEQEVVSFDLLKDFLIKKVNITL